MCFYEDKERGKLGEKVFSHGCHLNGMEVKDVSEDGNFQEDDVDIIIADGLKFEVKTDYRYAATGNIAIEDYIHYNKGDSRPGWLRTSTADYFVYVLPHPRNSGEFKIAIIESRTLREIAAQGKMRQCYDSNKVIDIFCLPLGGYEDFFETHTVNYF